MKRKAEEAGEDGRANGVSVRAVLHYLGPPGTYSHQVALGVRERLLQGATTPLPGRTVEEVILQPCATIADTVKEAGKVFKKGGIGLALLPYENNTNGPVTESFELIYSADEHAIHVIADAHLRVSHSLLATKETAEALLKGKQKIRVTDLRRLDSISSHVQALGQCSRLLNQYLRSDAQCIETTSTGEAARSLKDKKKGLHAAIASPVCTQDDVYGLVDIYPNLQNSNGECIDAFVHEIDTNTRILTVNTTRFLVCQIDTKKLANVKSTLQLTPVGGEANHRLAKAMLIVDGESSSSGELTFYLNAILDTGRGMLDGTALFISKIDRKPMMPDDRLAFVKDPDGRFCSAYVVEVEATALTAQAALKCLNEVRLAVGRVMNLDKSRWLGSWLAA
jgi:prephenate dehydratase